MAWSMHPVLSFLIRVNIRTDGCWEWLGSTKNKGYGVVRLSKCGKDEYAHRVMWELIHGTIPNHLHIRHKCDNPNCVCPEHLELGTHADNMRDKVIRNKSCRGETRPGRKLTEIDVRAIRRDPRSIRIVADDYPVSASTIQAIRELRKWRHVA